MLHLKEFVIHKLRTGKEMKSTLAHKSSHDKVTRTELTFLSKTSSEDGQNI